MRFLSRIVRFMMPWRDSREGFFEFFLLPERLPKADSPSLPNGRAARENSWFARLVSPEPVPREDAFAAQGVLDKGLTMREWFARLVTPEQLASLDALTFTDERPGSRTALPAGWLASLLKPDPVPKPLEAVADQAGSERRGLLKNLFAPELLERLDPVQGDSLISSLANILKPEPIPKPESGPRPNGDNSREV